MSAARRALSANERRVVDLLLADGSASRVELAERTGMSRASLNDLVARLVAAGLVEPVGEVASGRRGPNAVHFRVVAERALAVGVELQPEHVHVVVADLAGRVLADETTTGGVVDAVNSTRAGLGGHPLGRVVVGMPGVLGADGSVGYVAGHPAWRPDSVAELAQRLGCPVQVENDVNLLALAEGVSGTAVGAGSYAFLHLASGIRAATVLGGQPLRGEHGFAGELGLAVVPSEIDDDGAGAPAVGAAPVLLQELVGTAALDRLERVGGPRAAARRVAEAASLLVAMVDPELLVLGGPMGSAGGTELAAAVRAEVADLLPVTPRVLPTALGGDAVAQGALEIAVERARRDLYDSPTQLSRGRL